MCLKISWDSSIQIETHKHIDALRCVKPVKLRMYQLYKGVHQCHSRLRTECTSDMSKLTKMVEAGRADLCDVFLDAEVG